MVDGAEASMCNEVLLQVVGEGTGLESVCVCVCVLSEGSECSANFTFGALLLLPVGCSFSNLIRKDQKTNLVSAKECRRP